MALDIREAQDQLEDALRDAILLALGKRVAAVATVAALRAVVTMGASGTAMHDDMLAAVTVAGVTSGYRWSSQASAADDGTSTIKPNDVTALGRWVRWTSPLRLAPVINGPSVYLHELTAGPLERVILLDKNYTDKELDVLIFGQVPSVLIEATDDSPVDMGLSTGFRWDTAYHFTISIFAQNFRDRRQAAQGSTYAGEQPRGANKIDGLIMSLLGGTQMFKVEDGIRNIQVGRGSNWMSEGAQRRVIRGRSFAVQATVENPAASNDTGAVAMITAQQEMTTLGVDESTWVGGQDCITLGLDVSWGVGLAKTVAAGSASIGGASVAFAGEFKTFAANALTYRDLSPSGSMVYVATALGQPEPVVTAGALRIGVTATDGSGVVSDRIIAPYRVPYGPVIQTAIL